MKFAVKSLGCKVSQADAMLARRRLMELGHREATGPDADICVVNTCCITREAEAKSRQAVRRALADGAERVFVTGCAANLDARQFDDIASEAKALQGGSEEIAKWLANLAGQACIDDPIGYVGSPQGANPSQDRGSPQAPPEHRPESMGRTRGFVKVQDGCELNCAYCIIPAVRGGARSRPAAEVLDEVRWRVRHGQPEVVITGISVGGYRDAASGWGLARLMREVAGIEGVLRVRLSSIEVTHLTDSLIRALTDEPKVCSHLHLPLQSGDDRVLEAMGRRYNTGSYLSTVERVRKQEPGLNLTTDVIVGFPTEDVAAFENTLELVCTAGITKVHTFIYSERPGTRAKTLGDPVPIGEKRRRSRVMRQLSAKLARRHNEARLGAVEEVLIDRSADNRLSGYTSDYTRVHLEPGSAYAGECVRVKLEQLRDDGLWASPV